MQKKYLVGSCAVNEGDKVRRMLLKFNRYDVYDVLVIDDGSTDHALENLPPAVPVTVIRHPRQKGAGYCVREILEYANANGYEAVFFVSGNDKDDPADIAKMKTAIEQGADFVQGSRYCQGGQYGRMPFYRTIATRFLHPALFSLIAGRRITDSTNGFRAVKTAILRDPRIDLRQPWLEQYELEPYLFYKAIRLGYRVTEVPVTKIYPPKKEGYTKMRPFSGWWSILRPLVYLGLGIRK